MKRSVINLDFRPMLMFICSLLGIGTGFGLQATHPPSVPTYETIDYVVKVFQCIAFLGGGLAGFVSFHSWYKKLKAKEDKSEPPSKEME